MTKLEIPLYIHRLLSIFEGQDIHKRFEKHFELDNFSVYAEIENLTIAEVRVLFDTTKENMSKLQSPFAQTGRKHRPVCYISLRFC